MFAIGDGDGEECCERETQKAELGCGWAVVWEFLEQRRWTEMELLLAITRLISAAHTCTRL